MDEKDSERATATSTVDDAGKNHAIDADAAEKASTSSDTLSPANPKDQPAVNSSVEEEAAIDDDPNIVWWTGDDDPEDPHNWPAWRKYSNSVLISLLTLITPLASSVFAPAVPDLMVYFKSSNTELASFVVSVYVLGFACGPLVLAPLSEVYGRVPIYHICNIIFIIFTIGCAVAPTLNSLIVFRFFAGCFGAAPLTNGGGSIADMFTPEERAGMMALFSVGPLLGPIIGPAVGGVLAENKGWRWVFWLVVIIGGAVGVAMLLVMRESYAPVILERKTKRLRKETGNEQLRSKLDQGLTNKQLFALSIIRPMKLLLFSPICTVFAVYIMVVYGYLYLLFTTISYVFKQTYGFSSSNSGLVFLGVGVGCFLGMIWFAADSAMAIKRMKALDSESEPKPEIRLRLLPIGAIVYPIGFFVYGWTAHFETHWMGPIMGLFIIGIGNILSLMAVSVYLVDAYERYAASALAANTVMRSVAGAVLPLCALKMYDQLGLGWGNSLLGFISIALIPIPFLIQRYGEKLRKKFDASTL